MDLIDGAGVVDTSTAARWVPVQVTAALGEPIVAADTHGLHLDGPVAFGAFLAFTQTHGRYALPPMTADGAVDFALPLATWTRPAPGDVHPLAVNGAGEVWGWACSRALYTPTAHAKVEVRRKPAAEAMARYTTDRKHHISTGPMKARDQVIPATLVREAVWYALADPVALVNLLNRVTHLGRLTRHGHGRVLNWTVEPDEDARTRWAQRVFPDPAGNPDAIRAPYHHLSRRMPCSSTAPA